MNNQIAAILYFLDNNDIELNKRKIRRYFPSDESINDDRPYTIDGIQIMMDNIRNMGVDRLQKALYTGLI